MKLSQSEIDQSGVSVEGSRSVVFEVLTGSRMVLA